MAEQQQQGSSAVAVWERAVWREQEQREGSRDPCLSRAVRRRCARLRAAVTQRASPLQIRRRRRWPAAPSPGGDGEGRETKRGGSGQGDRGEGVGEIQRE